MTAEDWTPCRDTPEAWVGDNNKLRADAAKECARCPLHMFAACQKLATIDPFGVMAGIDHGVTPLTARERVEPKPLIPEDIKECEVCGATVHRGKRDRTDWAKLRFCSHRCHGVTMTINLGLPDSKTCEHCGNEFERAGRSPSHWTRARFCGVKCSAVASSRRRMKRAS